MNLVQIGQRAESLIFEGKHMSATYCLRYTANSHFNTNQLTYICVVYNINI